MGRHKLPRQLAESKLVCKDAGKPLALLALLAHLAPRPTIVFAASVQTTHRCTPDRLIMRMRHSLGICCAVPHVLEPVHFVQYGI